MAKILQDGYEVTVRSMLGVKPAELPDADINQRPILGMAEAIVSKRVPRWADLTDDTDKLYLETAVVAYICFLLCPSMGRRLNTEVTALDMKWKKAAVNWGDRADEFLKQYEDAASVLVPDDGSGTKVNLMGIAKHDITAGTGA